MYKILGLKMDFIIEMFAVEWVRLFKIRPYSTSALTVSVLAIAVVGATYLNKLDQEKREKGRLENQSYQQQINQLNQTETNIRQLLEFVNTQKRTLRETEDTISVLKSEKEKLKPIVDSDRAVVEALFRVQEERAVENIWRERWIGFGFGVIASLVASFLWFIIGLLIKGRKHNKQVQLTNDASID